MPVDGAASRANCRCRSADSRFALARRHAPRLHSASVNGSAAWKRYRGGQTTPIWIADLADSRIEKVPRENSNDFNPMWVGDTVYFLSDRNGPVTLFAYDIKSQAGERSRQERRPGLQIRLRRARRHRLRAVRRAHPLRSEHSTKAKHASRSRVAGDFPQVRPHFVKVDPKRIQNAGISPTGARAVFEAHGEIFTVPAEKGDIRNLTNTPAVAERDPAWSPDGKSIAYFSDASGEYELHIRDQNGIGRGQEDQSRRPPSFFYARAGRPTARRSPTPTSASTSGTSTSTRARRSRSTPTTSTGRLRSIQPGRPTASGSPTPSS